MTLLSRGDFFGPNEENSPLERGAERSEAGCVNRRSSRQIVEKQPCPHGGRGRLTSPFSQQQRVFYQYPRYITHEATKDHEIIVSLWLRGKNSKEALHKKLHEQPTVAVEPALALALVADWIHWQN